MEKFLIYDTDEGLDLNISCVSSTFPWISCKVFRVHDQENIYFEVIKSEEYMGKNMLTETEKSIGTFGSFQNAAKTAELIACTYRARNHWPILKRTLQ